MRILAIAAVIMSSPRLCSAERFSVGMMVLMLVGNALSAAFRERRGIAAAVEAIEKGA
jgi:hypothetical protein